MWLIISKLPLLPLLNWSTFLDSFIYLMTRYLFSANIVNTDGTVPWKQTDRDRSQKTYLLPTVI